MNILFVCTGNTCRSAMAEHIFNAMVSDTPDTICIVLPAGNMETQRNPGIYLTASSAGVFAYGNEPASENAVFVLREEMGIDMGTHRSRPLSKEFVDSADLILTMTREHKNIILRMYPEAAAKVYTLKEYASGTPADRSIEEYNYALDITDPFGMSPGIYKKCAAEIREAVEKLICRLKS